MRTIALILLTALCLSLLAGCMGTPVIYNNCTCPTGGENNTDDPPVAEGQLSLGLAIGTDLSGSKDAEKVDYNVTVVAVALDGDGVIRQCLIDGIAASVKIDGTGTIVSDVTAPVQTKNELGDDYGMVNIAHAKAEWYKQVESFCRYVIGKTVAQVKGIAVNEGTKPTDADLAASVTIAIGQFQALIEKAAANARALGSDGADVMKLGIMPSLSASKDGTAQLDVDVAALTMAGDVISACYIDSLQAKVSFDGNGKITTDLTAPVLTKNELGDDYGMVNIAHAKAEWYKQVEFFCQYVTGKTVAQVRGIAVNEGTKPTDADLAASVTIAIGGFQALIEKAAK